MVTRKGVWEALSGQSHGPGPSGPGPRYSYRQSVHGEAGRGGQCAEIGQPLDLAVFPLPSHEMRGPQHGPIPGPPGLRKHVGEWGVTRAWLTIQMRRCCSVWRGSRSKRYAWIPTASAWSGWWPVPRISGRQVTTSANAPPHRPKTITGSSYTAPTSPTARGEPVVLLCLRDQLIDVDEPHLRRQREIVRDPVHPRGIGIPHA